MAAFIRHVLCTVPDHAAADTTLFYTFNIEASRILSVLLVSFTDLTAPKLTNLLEYYVSFTDTNSQGAADTLQSLAGDGDEH